MSAVQAPSERERIEQRIAALMAQRWPDRRDAVLDAAIDDEVAKLRARLSDCERIERDFKSVEVQRRYGGPDEGNVLGKHIEKLRARLRYLEQHPDEDGPPWSY